MTDKEIDEKESAVSWDMEYRFEEVEVAEVEAADEALKFQKSEKGILDSVLVIGGGVAGVQASLDLADQGFRVYLVEKTPSIGGIMAALDKTFPTIDCSICILAPKLVECGRHPNIELLTYSEVKEVKGEAWDFTVKIERKPRYVDEEKCNGCGLCAEVCKVKVPNEFDHGLLARTAIYIPFPQAVPLNFTIDKEHCIGCGQCKIACQRDAIDFDMAPTTMEVNVGSIIIATGGDYYEPFDVPEYGFGKYKNVVTAMQFERILNASGPTKGVLLRPSDGKIIQKMAFIQCVGCRTKNKPYCSRTCCTYSTKEAIVAKEHEKTLEDVHIFYIDVRTVGKNFEDFFNRAKEEYGINYIKGIPGVIEEKEDSTLIVKYEDQNERKLKKMELDLVVLSTATLPSKGADKLAEKLGIELDGYGFVKEKNPLTNPIDTIKPGIFACGVSSGPKDIPDSVAQASGAAAMASLYVVPSEIEKEYPKEIDVTGKEPRIGVFVCNCGLNIGGYLDVPSVAEYSGTLPNVVYAEHNLFTCSSDSIERIKENIKEHDLNRVVVASCTPRTHEPLFRETCQEAGLNKYLFEMANIRDQCSWVHMRDSENGTQKAKDLVKIAVAKAKLLEPRYEKEVEIYPASLVVGAGISGMTAALNIADHGFEVHLIEKTEELGGLIKEVDTVPPEDMKPSELLDPIINKVKEHKNITLHTSTTVNEVKGYVGNFNVTLNGVEGEKNVTVGTIIVATGAKPFEPKGYYKYGENKNVVTQFDLEKLLPSYASYFEAKEAIKKDTVKEPKNVVMIQCVGAREEEGRTYCSRTCCIHAIKNARNVKREFPDANVYILYRDIRTVGEMEEQYYIDSQLEGIKYVRFSQEKPPKVSEKDGKLRVEVTDKTLGEDLTIDSDILALSTPLVANDDSKDLAQSLKVPVDKNGFFFEAHVKLRPVDFATDGIFLCGSAHVPKDIKDSVSQANGAAARALNLLIKRVISVEAVTSEVDLEKCIGCNVCVELCSYDAARIEEDGKSRIIEALCKGCGSCAVSCPTRAITAHQYKDEHYDAILNALFAEEEAG